MLGQVRLGQPHGDKTIIIDIIGRVFWVWYSTSDLKNSTVFRIQEITIKK